MVIAQDAMQGDDILKKQRRINRYWLFIIIFSIVILFLNGMARWQKFCDFYTDNLFGIWSETYGRLTGLFSFSVGEILIALAVIILLIAVICAVCLIFFRKKEGYKCFCAVYFKSLLVLVLSVLLVVTLNCSLLYNCSRLEVVSNSDRQSDSIQNVQTGETQNGDDNNDAQYTISDMNKLLILRNYLVEKCNELSLLVERDEKGNMIYSVDLDDALTQSLRALSEDYPRLSGYYPKAKPMLGSYFMYQADTLGIYFPFSMEANYNQYVSNAYKASTIAHELSHLKGYIYEDEANFIAFMACIGSEDLAVQYSGYLSVLGYVESDIYNMYNCISFVGKGTYEEFCGDVKISEQVFMDNVCYTEETLEALDRKNPLIDTDVVSRVSESFTDSYLDYYGAEANYDEVTLLLIQYYDGILY